jgi:intracellular multiplication protein IcmD
MKINIRKKPAMKQWMKYVGVIATVAVTSYAGAAFGAENIGSIAKTITTSFEGIAKFITAIAYVAGIAFSLGAIIKFKAHKDNPTQVPIGAPISLLFVGAALMFLPTLFGIAGQTVFGTTEGMGGLTGTTNF